MLPYKFACLSVNINLFLQKHIMAVVDGVTLVASVSLKVLQDGDKYSPLLEAVHRLHGAYYFNMFSFKYYGDCNAFELHAFGV